MPHLASTFIARRLVYRAVTTRTPVLATTGQGELGERSSAQSEIVILSGPEWQSLREGAQEKIVDAATKRIHVIDHEAGTVVSQSLYADVAFRKAEARNRLSILQVIDAGGGAIPGTRADIEACLGVEIDAPSPPRFRRGLLRRNRWMHRGDEVASVTPSKQELPTPLLRRWFAHEVMLHPRVAEAIAASGRVPKVLRHRLRLIPEIYERTLTLVEVDDLEVERGACLRGVTSSEPSDELHARVRRLLGRPLEQLPDRMAEGHAALEAGHYLEAMLWFMAHNWADPSGDPSGMAALDQALSEDDFAYGFRLAILTASEGEHLDEVLRVYDMAEERAGDLGHLIGVVRANALTTMASRERAPERRQELTERAQTELLRAIEADPGLAGVYKDLGDLCMERYDMALAWDLWDFGRGLAPGHSLFESIAEYERDLATRSPEFF